MDIPMHWKNGNWIFSTINILLNSEKVKTKTAGVAKIWLLAVFWSILILTRKPMRYEGYLVSSGVPECIEKTQP
ncbi:hypothetical protein [Agrobacterium cavarae]|uniref:hypothetical protein n=1 Tax=Agrobacterium cavarae TaxID=2528239 RepID=UPI003EE46FB4